MDPSIRTRGKARANDTVKSAALERLRAKLKRSKGADRSVVKIEEPIFDTLSDEDYNKLVAERRAEAKSFIVDDEEGGDLGYRDDGHEEDWTHPVEHSSEDDEFSESPEERLRPKKKSKGGKKKSRLSPKEVPRAKQTLISMVTGGAFKSSQKTKEYVDVVVSEALADVDNTSFEEWRSGKMKGSYVIPTLPPPLVQKVNTELSVLYTESSNCQANFPQTSSHLGGLNGDKDEKLDLGIDLETVKPARIDHPIANRELSREIKIKSKEGGGEDGLIRKMKVDTNETVRENREDARIPIELTAQGDDFALHEDGTLPFYMIDACEQTSGKIFLFGKVKTGNTYQSCCVVVKNMARRVYAIPESSVFPLGKIEELKKEYSSSGGDLSRSFRTDLQEMASELKNEIAQRLADLNVSSFMMAPVKRNYAFERSDIPSGEQYVLKINYPFRDRALDADLKGENFVALLGTHTSALELFLIKRRISGPCWLSISKFANCPCPALVGESWCKFEIIVDSPKDISPTSRTVQEIPPLVSVAISLKTIINEKSNTNEIVSASLVCCHNTKTDRPVESETEWKGSIGSCTLIRKLEGITLPTGYKQAESEWNNKAGYKLLSDYCERSLINRLMAEIYKLDPDVLVGHNISAFDLDILLHRSQVHKKGPRDYTWSKIGRLKQREVPKNLKGGKSIYGSGASLGIMNCIAGRLLCDTFLSSRELLNEVSYSLTEVSKTELGETREEIPPHHIPSMYQHIHGLLKLVQHGEHDAMLALKLMFKLSILPLTRQLTNLSGNLWSQTLQNARAQRVEYLLLHAFHKKKFMLPDKWGPRIRESNPTPKRKSNQEELEENNDNIDLDNVNITNQGKGKRGPSYAGGLVLEPKAGLYDKFVLLLDFNSLYPSVIQEYNICFTTVERSVEGIRPSLPSTGQEGVLPQLLGNLIEERVKVKKIQKQASGDRLNQLNIKQQALKLTANSIYGCLGFHNSRFYAKPLAELVTLQGRRILQDTVDLVQDKLRFEVIYGDTDSIMINTGLDDVNKAYEMAKMVIKEVKKKYRCLEIGLDGFYARLLLLKKKKYAGMKLIYTIDHTGIKETAEPIKESKGVDMVRRDWSLVAINTGDFCLDCILDKRISSEEAIEKIHTRLREVRVQLDEDQEKMRKGEINIKDLRKYEITKTLTKPPEDYPDARNQPHVQVAVRMKKSGHTGFSVGHTIPYIICCEQDAASSGPCTGIAQRARHLKELEEDKKRQWLIDINYYLSQQIHPVVSRLCASIQGTSPARLAECLGLDSSKFLSRVSEHPNQDPSSVLLSLMDEEERYKGCEPLMLTCPRCASSFECPPVSSLLTASTGTENRTTANNFWHKMRCPRCPSDAEKCIISSPMLANQVKIQAERFASAYHNGLMVCDAETCKYATRTLNLRQVGDAERGTVCPRYPSCDGHLVRQYKDADLYKQLSYFHYVLDSSRCLEMLDFKARAPFENQFLQIRKIVYLALEQIDKVRSRYAFGWVRLSDFCVSI